MSLACFAGIVRLDPKLKLGFVLTDLLDARTAPLPPIQGAVNIPVAELPDSGAELPRDGAVRVAGTGLEAETAVKYLHEMGRSAVLEHSFSYGENPKPLRLWSPNEFLESLTQNLGPGRALDLACGCGREAAYLASLGWEVTAVDRLSDALERAERLADRYGVGGRVRWLQGDVEAGFEVEGEYDLLTMFFFLDRAAMLRHVPRLRPGGSFVFESFSLENRELFGKPRRIELASTCDELRCLVEPLSVAECSQALRGSGKHTCRLRAVRSSA